MNLPSQEHPIVDAFVRGDYATCLDFSDKATTGRIPTRLEPLLVLSALYEQQYGLYTELGQRFLARADPTSMEATVLRLLLGQVDVGRLETSLSEEDSCRLGFYAVNMSLAFKSDMPPLRGLSQVAMKNVECPECVWARRQLHRIALEYEAMLWTKTEGISEALFDLAYVAQAYLLGSHRDEAQRVADEVSRRLGESDADQPEYQIAAFNNLAAVYGGLGQKKNAVQIAERAIKLGRQVLGSGHADVATDLLNLGQMLLADDRVDEAVGPLTEALSIRRVLEPGGASTLLAMWGLAQAMDRKGDFAALQMLAEDIAAICQRSGVYHEVLGFSARRIADFQQRSGDLEGAIQTLRKAADLTEGLSGENVGDYAQLISKLGGLYQETGMNGSSKTCYVGSGRSGVREIIDSRPRCKTWDFCGSLHATTL